MARHTIKLSFIRSECIKCGYPMEFHVKELEELEAENKALREALLPFTKINQRADYSYGVIKESDVQRANELLNRVEK